MDATQKLLAWCDEDPYHHGVWHNGNLVRAVFIAEEIRAICAERDALKAARPTLTRKLREVKGVTYWGGKWWINGESYHYAFELLHGTDTDLTDADHAAIYALKDDPYEPVDTVEEVLYEMYGVLGVQKIILPDFHEECAARLRQAVHAEGVQGE